MLNYIIRRLVLMVPTLIGITFLVFCLLAFAPGGIGAAIQAQAGGDRQAASQVAVQQAYLEDRYGLNDPVVVQYLRWLGRISPLKFGRRDQWLPAPRQNENQPQRFELISPPKKPAEIPLAEWFPSTQTVEPVGPYQPPAGASQDDLAKEFRVRERAYFEARYDSLVAGATLESALIAYAREAKIPGGVDELRIKPNLRAIAAAPRQEGLASYQRVQELGKAATAKHAEAVSKHAQLDAMFNARPFDEAGFGLSGLVSIAAPDLGTAFSKSRPVAEIMWPALLTTMSLNIVAIPIIYLIAIPSGMLAAVRRGSVFDVGLGTVYIALFSFPVLLAGVLMIGFLASKEYLNAFPVAGLSSVASEQMAYLPRVLENGEWERGWLLDRIWHMCLPLACLVYGGFAILSKQTRAAMLENFSMDYVRTAKAKGVAPMDVILRHVFRNSLLPLITIFVTVFPAMLAGSIVVERIFSIPGMGMALLDAIANRDAEMILANTVIIAMVNLMALLLADILYALADPRVTYD